MADFTASPRNSMLLWLVGKADPSATATRYITTFNGDPQGAGTENLSSLTGSSSRINMTTAMTTSPSSGTLASTSDITFTASASSSATVDYVAVYDNQTAGNLLASASVTSKSITAGDGLKILAGNLTFSIT
jgi:hypothetical protein